MDQASGTECRSLPKSPGEQTLDTTSPELRDAVAVVWKYIQNDDRKRAEHLVRQLRQAEPLNAEVHFLMGILAYRDQRAHEASQALQICLELKPDYPEAWNNLGNAQAAQGNFVEAENSYRKAIHYRSIYPEASNNLGNVLKQLNKLDEAIEYYQAALKHKPDYVEAHSNLGNAYRRQELLPEALASYSRALKLRADYPEALNNQGIVFASLGRHSEAISSFQRAVELRSDYHDAHSNLGIAYLEKGQFDKAIAAFEQTLAANPEMPGVQYNLGAAYSADGRPIEAIRAWQNTIRLDPTSVEGHRSLGEIFRLQGQFEEALQHFRQAAELADDAQTHCDYGQALASTGRHHDAIEEFSKAISLDPQLAQARKGHAQALLVLGEFDKGWDEWQTFRRHAGRFSFYPKELAWDGVPLDGKTILLRADAEKSVNILLIRYAVTLQQRCGNVIVLAAKSEKSLLERCRVNSITVTTDEEHSGYDVHCSITDLPVLFNTSLETIPRKVPYIDPTPELVARYRKSLKGISGIKVGIAWQSTHQEPPDDRSSIPLVQFGRILGLGGVNLVPLQVRTGPDCLPEIATTIPLLEFDNLFSDPSTSLDNLASLLQGLDLVISADCTVAHLAGALGVPIWLAISHVSSWPWLTERQDSPWYPTMRLFRQKVPGDWCGVFDEIVEALFNEHSLHTPSNIAGSRLSPQACIELGSTLAQKGQTQDAATCFRLALDLEPRSAKAHNELGNVLRKIGQADLANEHFEKALEYDPSLVEALNNLGINLATRGNPKLAVEKFRKATELKPDYAHAYSNLGFASLEIGDIETAEQACRKAVELKPDFANTQNNMGLVFARKKEYDTAEACFQEAIRLSPDFSEAYNNLGNVFRETDQFPAAVAAYREAIRVRTDYCDAHNNLGIALARQKKFDEAVEAYRCALRINANFVDAHNNMGIALGKLERPNEAIVSYERALAIRPDYAEAHSNLGISLTEVWRHDDAIQHFEEALRLKPEYAAAHSNLGIALTELGRADEALANYTEAVRIDKDYAEAHMNRALALLQKGEFKEGWKEYEWRWKCKHVSRMQFKQPVWDGDPINGKTLVIYAEQGLGDSLQFIRYAQLAKAAGANVIFLSPSALIPILQRTPGIDHLIKKGDPLPQYDFQIPLLNLPHIFGTTLRTIPNEVPYIFADPAKVQFWRQELRAIPGFKVGISWQGNPQYRGDRHRSVPLVYYSPLAKIDGVRIISLQKHFGKEQIGDVSNVFRVLDLGTNLDEQSGPFMDTAAVMVNLDLIITSDTALVHLAGALGVPVWMPLGFASDWRWLRDVEYSPWYPSMRIFRQRKYGNWEDVFQRMAGALRQHIQQARSSPRLIVEVAPGELLDKITILQIKTDKIENPRKLTNVRKELAELDEVREWGLPSLKELDLLVDQLRETNAKLWDIEDDIRCCERDRDFGPRFIDLARSVYQTAEARADLKKRINRLLKSRIQEEKEYVNY